MKIIIFLVASTIFAAIFHSLGFPSPEYIYGGIIAGAILALVA